MPPIFMVKASLTSFPSDNALDSMPLQKRIAIKKVIKADAFYLGNEWLQKNNIKRWNIKKTDPLFKGQVRTILQVFLKEGTSLDPSNLSIKHFLDELVAMGIVADDSEKFIPESITRFSGYVPGDSHAWFVIEEME